jgi:CTP-dependent riboflavin kinase
MHEKIKVKYISYLFINEFRGVSICQVQQVESEFPDDTFIIVGWEAPRFGSVRIYTVLVETRRDNFKWVIPNRTNYVLYQSIMAFYFSLSISKMRERKL